MAITPYRVPLPYIGINIFELLLILLVGITLLQRSGRIYGTRLDVSIFLFGLACILGYITCIVRYDDPSRLFEPRRLLHFFIAYYLTVNLIRTKKSLQIFLLIYFSAIVLKSIEGVYLYSMGEGLQIKWKIRAIFTGWEDSLNFVTFLLFTGACVMDRYKFRGRIVFLLFSPAVFFCFLFSYKRAYYVAIVVGIMTLFLLQGKKARFRFLVLILIMVLIGSLIIAAAGQWNAIEARINSILHPTKESSASYRLVEWQNALISIYRHPIVGIGLGGIMPMEIYLSRTNILGVHNTFLWVAVKMGIIGLFTYLLLHFAYLQRLIKLNYVLQDPFLRVVSRGLLCSFIAFCTAEMFAPMFAQMRTGTWLGVMMGLGMLLSKMEMDNKTACRNE